MCVCVCACAGLECLFVCEYLQLFFSLDFFMSNTKNLSVTLMICLVRKEVCYLRNCLHKLSNNLLEAGIYVI